MKKIKRVIGIILLSAMVMRILSGLAGCYTEKKAESQTGKAAEKFPLVVADIARKMFPCVQKDSIIKEYSDSTQWIKSREAAAQNALRYRKLADSLRLKLMALPEALKQACKEYQEVIDEQASEIIKLNGIVQNGLQPVIKWREKTILVEDSAKVKLANAELERSVKEFSRLLSKRDAENETLKAEVDKWQGRAKRRGWINAGLIALFLLIIGYNIRRVIKKKIPVV